MAMVPDWNKAARNTNCQSAKLRNIELVRNPLNNFIAKFSIIIIYAIIIKTEFNNGILILYSQHFPDED